jgi:protein-S-isoprenylcysteine O-methyltransferase Ste14
LDGKTRRISSEALNLKADSFFRRGGVWVAAQASLMTAVIVLALWFRGSFPGSFVRPFGLCCLFISGFLGAAGVLSLGRNLTPFPKPKHRSTLVQRGIYGVVRHPLYAAVMLAALGCALAYRSWPGLLAGFALILFFNAKATMEERWLLERFPEYQGYAKRVKRFIPFIW